MGKNKKNKRTVGLFLEDEVIEDLKKKSHEISLAENKNVSYLDLIKRAIQKVYFK